MPIDHLSLDEARRLSLAAQGFVTSPRRTQPAAHDLSKTIRRLGLLQLDYVNVLVPAHYLVLFSRLGAYRRTLLDEIVYDRREFTEQWAHEASILPVEHWPLLRDRRETGRIRPSSFESLAAAHSDYIEWVLDEVRRRGPLSADDLPGPEGTPRRIAGAWYGAIPRIVLEAHFARGHLAVAARRQNLARIYDLSERLIQPEHYERRLSTEESHRELLLLAARAHGVGTAADLADYYRMPITQARPRLKELIEAGKLREVRIEGWSEPAYLHPLAELPKKIDAAALLSPFDPVVWFRPRAARLFGFDYRIEIYTPQHQRKWGYYVLPFLLGDRIVGRLDLKADRGARRLLVLAAYTEPGIKTEDVAGPLAAELWRLAGWLELDDVSVARRSGFDRQLRAALRK